MATVSVKIIYPREGSAVCTGRVYVFGIADPDDSTITGTITPRAGSAPIDSTPLSGDEVPPAYDWGLAFDGVHSRTILRLDVTAKKGGYGDGKATHHFHARHPPSFGPQITIDSPASGANVTAPFTVFGYVDPDTSQMSAWVQPANLGQPQMPGAPITPVPAPYDWAYRFMVPGPGNYTAMIQGVSATGTTIVPWPVQVT